LEGQEQVCLEELLDAGVEIVHMLPGHDYFAVCVDTDEEAQLVASLNDVYDTEPDPVRTLSYIPESQEKVHRMLAGQQIPYGVKLVGAERFWNRYNNKGGGITVCVIDTGLRAGHEDIRDADIDGSNDGDLQTPWNRDGNSHGTHVAGTIAAVDNDHGVVGVAPGVKIFVARVFDGDGAFTASGLIAAWDECKKGGSDIISMSLGGAFSNNQERNAIRALANDGILMIAAAGNSGNTDNPVEYPAATAKL